MSVRTWRLGLALLYDSLEVGDLVRGAPSKTPVPQRKERSYYELE